MVLYGPQGNSLGLLYALANKFTVFSQVYSTTDKQVSPPSSPSAALANFLYQPTLCLMQNFSPITYPSKGIRWLLCDCELVTIMFHLWSDDVLFMVCEIMLLSVNHEQLLMQISRSRKGKKSKRNNGETLKQFGPVFSKNRAKIKIQE